VKPQAMWEEFAGDTKSDCAYSVWHFCDNEKYANELAELVLKGLKTATASVYELYCIEGEDVPTA